MGEDCSAQRVSLYSPTGRVRRAITFTIEVRSQITAEDLLTVEWTQDQRIFRSLARFLVLIQQCTTNIAIAFLEKYEFLASHTSEASLDIPFLIHHNQFRFGWLLIALLVIRSDEKVILRLDSEKT